MITLIVMLDAFRTVHPPEIVLLFVLTWSWSVLSNIRHGGAMGIYMVVFGLPAMVNIG